MIKLVDIFIFTHCDMVDVETHFFRHQKNHALANLNYYKIK